MSNICQHSPTYRQLGILWTNIFYNTEFLRGENGLDGNFFQEMLVEKAEVTDFFSLKILANADYPLVLGQQS